MGMDRKIEKKKGIRLKHLIYGAAGLALVLLMAKMISGSGVSTLRVEREKITVEEVQYDDFDDFIRTNGSVAPYFNHLP
jgi:HlyD family secretion protein